MPHFGIRFVASVDGWNSLSFCSIMRGWLILPHHASISSARVATKCLSRPRCVGLRPVNTTATSVASLCTIGTVLIALPTGGQPRPVCKSQGSKASAAAAALWLKIKKGPPVFQARGPLISLLARLNQNLKSGKYQYFAIIGPPQR
jgi:hypothetical protein